MVFVFFFNPNPALHPPPRERALPYHDVCWCLFFLVLGFFWGYVFFFVFLWFFFVFLFWGFGWVVLLFFWRRPPRGQPRPKNPHPPANGKTPPPPTPRTPPPPTPPPPHELRRLPQAPPPPYPAPTPCAPNHATPTPPNFCCVLVVGYGCCCVCLSDCWSCWIVCLGGVVG